CWWLGTGCWLLVAGCWVRSAGRSGQSAGCRVDGAKCRLVVDTEVCELGGVIEACPDDVPVREQLRRFGKVLHDTARVAGTDRPTGKRPRGLSRRTARPDPARRAFSSARSLSISTSSPALSSSHSASVIRVSLSGASFSSAA